MYLFKYIPIYIYAYYVCVCAFQSFLLSGLSAPLLVLPSSASWATRPHGPRWGGKAATRRHAAPAVGGGASPTRSASWILVLRWWRSARKTRKMLFGFDPFWGVEPDSRRRERCTPKPLVSC